AGNLGLSLYLAPVGEPAMGPVAFPHRPSAANDPLAPISHHWQDGTHITFGVLTAGVFTRTAQLEASWFNGREPDEDRTDFDYAGRRLDSYSARVTVNPGPRWSFSGWYAYLRSPEELRPDESLHRFGVSVLTTQPFGGGGDPRRRELRAGKPRGCVWRANAAGHRAVSDAAPRCRLRRRRDGHAGDVALMLFKTPDDEELPMSGREIKDTVREKYGEAAL